jgi:hypothetical protein
MYGKLANKLPRIRQRFLLWHLKLGANVARNNFVQGCNSIRSPPDCAGNLIQREES